jgi:ubiquinone biosynthesis protein COQ9
MDNAEFDRALMAAAFALAAERGWARLSVAAAARRAHLPLDRARRRFPGRGALLVRFGRMADQAALAEVEEDETPHERLQGLLIRRIEVLQEYRTGILALLRALPADPALALFLTMANLRSMAWMLEAAGISSTGPAGVLRTKGLLGVWLWTVRAWQRDTSTYLDATQAALDRALMQAERWAGWLPDGGATPAQPREPPPPEPPDAVPGPLPEPPLVM